MKAGSATMAGVGQVIEAGPKAGSAHVVMTGVVIEKDGTRKEFTQTFEVQHGSNPSDHNP